VSELIDLDPGSTDPPYEQLRSRITALARAGELAPHTRLPAVRRLAGDLNVAPGTVARAYRELEAAGVVETRGRLGTFVVGGDAATDPARELAADYARRVTALGVSPERALDLARAALWATPS
jgi:DNA-binding transcriptional regulator YhcF (GntR family)